VTIEAPATARRASYTSAIYGVVSIAAVIVAWEADGNEWHLIEVISGYLLTLWLTHSYAALVSTGEFAPWRHVLRHEFSVAGAGLPALGVAILGQIFKWDIEETSDVALIACAVTLFAIQASLLRHLGAGRRRLGLTVVCDMACAAVIVSLHVII
jgi:hypothetical protein